MSILVPLLLTLLVRSGCHTATLLHTSIFLKESIRLLDELLEAKVPCDKMNVTNVFAGDKQDNDLETLCKATTVTWEGRSCHRHLEGIHLNLLSLLRRKSRVYKAPCPVPGGSTTSLGDFLLDLRRALHRLVKGQSLK
ncbi:interleukin-4 [Pezoporus occidentalis]|uniref:interleukin-4 n=1 Tax=Pezoporus occidentalis TaxID=407982 RepID=UPI002F9107DA